MNRDPEHGDRTVRDVTLALDMRRREIRLTDDVRQGVVC
jgi:hypothetical protein